MPLLLRTPESRAHTSAELVSLLDVAPTLLDLSRLPSDGFPGRSFASLLRGEEAELRLFVILDHGEGRLSIRTKSRKLLNHADSTQFFDLEADPGELHDLGEDPGRQREIEALATLLETESERVRRQRSALKGRDIVELSTEEEERLRALGCTEEGE